MLGNRLYKPVEGDKLYHYCSPDTLHAICSHRTLRFSDIFAMNDFMEMHWGYQIFELAAAEMIGSVGKELIDDINEILHGVRAKVLPLASCLSTQGDVLSQWRAYGEDGAGYAIGFDAMILNQLAARQLMVSYDKDQQIAEVKSLIAAIHEVESEHEEPRSEGFFTTCMHFACDIAAFKNPAFSEEREVRLLHVINYQESNNSLRLVDSGGHAFGKDTLPGKVNFNMRGSIPVAHMDIDYSDAGNQSPIIEVVLGPKNNSLPSGISVFLETMDIPNVSVRRSEASYR